MLNSTQIKNITYVYVTLMNSEGKGWDEYDDSLEIVEWLDNDQLMRESDLLYSYHKNKNIRCAYKECNIETCFVKNILEAVESIIELFEETKDLHVKNRYILCNYIALCQGGHIIEC